MIHDRIVMACLLGACGSAATAPPPAIAPRPESPPPRLTGFELPESVLWDDRADVYLVGNMRGDSRTADDNGSISRVGPDGARVDRWIDGADPAVELHAPKGMAVAGDALYVADIQHVRVFDRATGAPRASWPIPGAVMLNDIAAGDGAIYVSDSGLSPNQQPASAEHAMWKLELTAGGAAPVPRALIRGRDLGRPNGLAVRGRDVWLATGKGELIHFVDDREVGREKLPVERLDGVVIRDDGRFYISSWDADGVVYVGKPGGPWTVALRDLKSAADIGWDARRARLLLPILVEGIFEARPMP